MSLDYINRFYGQNLKVGDLILFRGVRMKIEKAEGAHLIVKNDNGDTFRIHPTWEVKTQQEAKE